MNIPAELLNKYNKAVPRYTSYPPANYFNADITHNKYVSEIQKSNTEQPQNLSFYIHIPFCNQLCFYCGCNTAIGRNQDTIKDYVQAVKSEIMMLRKLINPDRKISQIHWGGGTPNSIDIAYIQEIMHLFYDNFDFIEDAEIAMECNPAYLTDAYLDEIFKLRFNRLSIGIQDFDNEVLKTVNREIPIRPVEDIVNYIRKNSNISINLDFIYGLPLQTVESFERNIKQAMKIKPERLVTFSYAHVPWMKPAQKKLETYGLPQANEKIKMYEAAYQIITKNGYSAIGLDHYALKNDELSIALSEKLLHRNFQGYCTRETTGQVYAVGVSSISQLHSAYIQNTKKIDSYIDAISSGKFAVEKAYILNNAEIAVRESINQLMCNLEINWDNMANSLNISRETLLSELALNPEKTAAFIADGLIEADENGIRILEKGKFFIRNIAAALDPLTEKGGKSFSKAL